jgi:hypothetical protein
MGMDNAASSTTDAPDTGEPPANAIAILRQAQAAADAAKHLDEVAAHHRVSHLSGRAWGHVNEHG